MEEKDIEKGYGFGGMEFKPPSRQDIINRIKKIGNIFSEDKNRTGRISRRTIVNLEETHSHILKNSSFLQSLYWKEKEEKFNIFLEKYGIKRKEKIDKFIQIAIDEREFKIECWFRCSGEFRVKTKDKNHLSIMDKIYEYEPWYFLVKENTEYRIDFRCNNCIKNQKGEGGKNKAVGFYKELLKNQDKVWHDNRISYLNNLTYPLYTKTFWWSYYIRSLKEKFDRESFGSVKGICTECENNFNPRYLQLHHEKEAYEYIGRENECLHLLRWVCGPCHKSIHFS